MVIFSRHVIVLRFGYSINSIRAQVSMAVGYKTLVSVHDSSMCALGAVPFFHMTCGALSGVVLVQWHV